MATPTTRIHITLSFFSLLFLLLTPLPLSSSSSQYPACKSTPYPKLCRWMLSAFNSSSSSSPFNYTQFSIKQCLKHARKLSGLVNRYLQRHVDDGAVSDCGQLLDLNVDYLQRIMEELGSADDQFGASSSDELVGRVEALLSGVVTNQQTCYDGMRESDGGWDGGFASGIHAPVVNGTQLYSVALGLVTHALDKAGSGHNS